MKKISVDLNVLLDFLNKRECHLEAAKVIDLCVKKEIKGYLCAHEMTTLAYFLVKEHKDGMKVRQVLTTCMDIFTMLPVDEDILRGALDSPVSDFEDAVIEVSSMKEGVDYIITCNITDFKSSRVKAVLPGDFLRTFHLHGD